MRAALAILAAIALATPAHAAVTFIAGAVQARAGADVWSPVQDPTTTESAFGEQVDDTLVGAPLHAQADVDADLDFGPEGTLEARADYTADGSFNANGAEFLGVGQDVVTGDIADALGQGYGSYRFFYVFSLDRLSRITIQYDLFDTQSYAEGLILDQSNGVVVVKRIQETLQGTATGSLTYLLPAGFDYFLNIDSLGATVTRLEGPGVLVGDSRRYYRIAIAAVPEPQTWALMILGFGLAGGGLRQARSRALA